MSYIITVSIPGQIRALILQLLKDIGTDFPILIIFCLGS